LKSHSKRVRRFVQTSTASKDGLRLGISAPTRQHPPAFVMGYRRMERADPRPVWSPNASEPAERYVNIDCGAHHLPFPQMFSTIVC